MDNETKKIIARKRAKIWFNENRERARENAREYYLKNKEKIKSRVKIYANRPEVKIQRKKTLASYREENREKLHKQQREWYARHKNEPRLKAEKSRFFKNWNERNKDYRREYTRKRMARIRKETPDVIKEAKRREKKRKLSTPQGRLEMNLRQRLRAAIRTQSAKKSGKTYDLVGMSARELCIYLEKKFTAGMSWDNYGKWHIDHKVPICSFDLTKEENQKKAFHYKNLQPLWAVDNLKKGGRIK